MEDFDSADQEMRTISGMFFKYDACFKLVLQYFDNTECLFIFLFS